MIMYWVKTEDGKLHQMGATSGPFAPGPIMFPEVIEWYEERFGSPVEWFAVDRLDNVVWERGK